MTSLEHQIFKKEDEVKNNPERSQTKLNLTRKRLFLWKSVVICCSFCLGLNTVWIPSLFCGGKGKTHTRWLQNVTYGSATIDTTIATTVAKGQAITSSRGCTRLHREKSHCELSTCDIQWSSQDEWSSHIVSFLSSFMWHWMVLEKSKRSISSRASSKAWFQRTWSGNPNGEKQMAMHIRQNEPGVRPKYRVSRGCDQKQDLQCSAQILSKQLKTCKRVCECVKRSDRSAILWLKTEIASELWIAFWKRKQSESEVQKRKRTRSKAQQRQVSDFFAANISENQKRKSFVVSTEHSGCTILRREADTVDWDWTEFWGKQCFCWSSFEKTMWTVWPFIVYESVCGVWEWVCVGVCMVCV